MRQRVDILFLFGILISVCISLYAMSSLYENLSTRLDSHAELLKKQGQINVEVMEILQTIIKEKK